MAVLTPADFEAIVDSGIDTATIEAAIAREEAALARRLGGPLDDERTDTPYPAGHDGPLTLRRFASAVTVTSDGAVLDVTMTSAMWLAALRRHGGRVVDG